jgi:hypothetical protein
VRRKGPLLKARLRATDPAGVSLPRRRRALVVLVAVGWLAACATPRPVLRDVARRGGSGEVARECAEADRAYRESSRGRREQVGIVGIAVLSTAAAGAAAGGIYGAYEGNTAEAATVGAVAGSGAGLLGGIAFMVSKVRRDSRLRIGRCARERGYEVIGWQ